MRSVWLSLLTACGVSGPIIDLDAPFEDPDAQDTIAVASDSTPPVDTGSVADTEAADTADTASPAPVDSDTGGGAPWSGPTGDTGDTGDTAVHSGLLSVPAIPAGGVLVAHPETLPAILAQSVVCLTMSGAGFSGGTDLVAIGMDDGGTTMVTNGSGPIDFDLTTGLGTVYGAPASVHWELGRNGDEVWNLTAFTGITVYANEAAFNAGTSSRTISRPGTSSRITILGTQGFGLWHSTRSVNLFDVPSGALTGVLQLQHYDTWVWGASAVGTELFLIDDSRGSWSHLGRRIAAFDIGSGRNTRNVFVPRGAVALPALGSGLSCFTPP